MFRSIFILLLALHHTFLWAGEVGIIINGKAIHLASEEGKTYNEKNWGTGIQYNFDQSPSGWRPFISASGFIDSHNNNSYYAGGGYVHRINMLSTGNDFVTSIGATGFIMTRKTSDGDKVFPGILPALSIGTKYLAFNITYVPKFSDKVVPLYYIQAVMPIDDIGL